MKAGCRRKSTSRDRGIKSRLYALAAANTGTVVVAAILILLLSWCLGLVFQLHTLSYAVVWGKEDFCRSSAHMVSEFESCSGNVLVCHSLYYKLKSKTEMIFITVENSFEMHYV